MTVSCEYAGTVGALAATNSPSAVLVAQMPLGSPPLSTSAVHVLLGSLVLGAVSTDVQPFPKHPNTYAIEARCHPWAGLPVHVAL